MTYRWVYLFKDGDAVPVQERLDLWLIKKMILEGDAVYCPDSNLRKVVGYSKKRCRFWDLLGVLLGPAWSAEPILSEPIRPYELQEFKSAIAKQLIRWSRESGIPGAKAQAALARADSFEAICELLADPESALEHLDDRKTAPMDVTQQEF